MFPKHITIQAPNAPKVKLRRYSNFNIPKVETQYWSENCFEIRKNYIVETGNNKLIQPQFSTDLNHLISSLIPS